MGTTKVLDRGKGEKFPLAVGRLGNGECRQIFAAWMAEAFYWIARLQRFMFDLNRAVAAWIPLTVVV